jgi:histidinol-phosphate aminotransferase
MPAIANLIRPEIAELEPYTPILPLDVLAERLGLPVERLVKLDANENPYGPSPRAIAALADEAHYHIYPDPGQTKLRAGLSAYSGQPAGRIVCGAGADELIDLILRLCIAPGDAVIDCPPTFGMYSFDTGVCGGRVIQVPRLADFSLDVDGIERAAAASGAKILFLTSPNNPTGNLTPPAQVERLLRLPLLVVVDEAYIEFVSDRAASVSPWVGRYENLAVLRTFSKWAGLAGLRVGYGLLPEWLAEQVWKIKQPYNINQAAQVAALASLDDLAHMRAIIDRLLAERGRLFEQLRDLPALDPLPSAANFILCRVRQGSARELKLALERQGVLVRHYSTPLLRDFIRVSVGTPAQTDAVVAALQAAS